jgi:hypothetical protein
LKCARRESIKVSEKSIVLPAYDYCLKCSHIFNILDARGAISVAERTKYIERIRNLARLVASLAGKRWARNYLAQREEMGIPPFRTEEDVEHRIINRQIRGSSEMSFRSVKSKYETNSNTPPNIS